MKVDVINSHEKTDGVMYIVVGPTIDGGYVIGHGLTLSEAVMRVPTDESERGVIIRVDLREE